MSLLSQFSLGKAIRVLALAALLPFLYERGQVLSLLYKNDPVRLNKVNALGKYEIKFKDQVRSCEDVILIEELELAILACDPGRERWNTVMGVFAPGEPENAALWMYSYSDIADATPAALTRIELINFDGENDFHTLGLAYHDKSSTLFVTSHAKAGPRIELFKFNAKLKSATHIKTISHPLINGPNSIALLNGDEFYVSNDHLIPARQSKILSLLETYLATPTGAIVYVNLQGSEIEAKLVARAPFANGIELLGNSVAAVASTSGAAVYLYTMKDATTWEFKSQITLPFLPDNLSSSAGILLIAGHGHAPTLTRFTHTRQICNNPKELEQASPNMNLYCEGAEAVSWVSEWSEESGVRHLYVDTDYPTSSTAVKDAKKGFGIISGFYAKGILVWKE